MKPAPRWGWRFSLRGLFVAVTCSALVLALGLLIRDRGLRQRRAFDEVYKLGGGAVFDPNDSASPLDFYYRSIAVVHFSGPAVNDEQLKVLSEFSRLKTVSLDHCTRISDRSVPVLKSLRNLELLILRGTAVSDEAADQLRHALPQCEVVTHVTCRCRGCSKLFDTRDVTGRSLCPACTDREAEAEPD